MYQHIFDSHAHYDDKRFDGDRDALLESFPGEGIWAVLNAASDLASSQNSLALAQKYSWFYGAAGIHPDSVMGVGEKEYEAIAQLLAQPKMVALGEIGLDYYYDDASPREIQREVFRRQLQLAVELDKPVIIHDRDAHQDTMELLRRYRPKGVMHCYSGSAEMAKEVVKLGMYLGFTGAVTFKNARRAVEAAQEIPLDRLLIETDCPYMAPEPVRGRRSDSRMLIHTGTRLAQIKGVTPQELFDATRENACRLFGIPLERTSLE